MTNQGTVNTVTGVLGGDQLGVTLPHEHLICDFTREYRGEGIFHDFPTMAAELDAASQAGVHTVVDLTNESLGREPRALRDLSERTGVQIVVGSSFYRHQYAAARLYRMPTKDLADLIVQEITEGIGDTGIRAGIIGEIGSDQHIEPVEERIFRASARAQHRTGVALNVHAARWPIAHGQLDLLEEEGCDLRRVVVSHCDTVGSIDWREPDDVLKYQLSLAERGAYVEFDTLRTASRLSDPEMDRRIRYIRNLIDNGFIDHVLLSHDIFFTSHLLSNGGGGLTVATTYFADRMRDAGIPQGQIDRIFIDNPRRMLTGS
ncbi:phosphotriesterase [Pseudonocardia hispaniensis]|uniref:Phosphotriesterase n=1 Tax=Pseudonocardia hispaniensis TaxID=904933 RepID=A0ABW1IX83_9PSEU